MTIPMVDILLNSSTREEMLSLAQDIQVDVSQLMRSYTADRNKLNQTLESSFYDLKTSTLGSSGNSRWSSSHDSCDPLLDERTIFFLKQRSHRGRPETGVEHGVAAELDAESETTENSP